MKKWIYVIIPGLMLAIFIYFYYQERSYREGIERERQARVAAQREADEAHRLALEKAAREESDRRAAQQAAEAAKQEADRIAKFQADLKGVEDQEAAAEADLAASQKTAADLRSEKIALQNQKEQDLNEEFELTREVEDARVAQQSAELDNQRMIAMIADRASQSQMAQPPPPPPAR